MRNNCLLFDDLNELKIWEIKMIEDFKIFYKNYEEQFLKFGIQLSIQPCFCHYKTQRYYTKRKNTGSYLAFKVRLFPANLSYKSAKKAFLYKEFISHKVSSYKTFDDKVQVKVFNIKDSQLIVFLTAYLKKVKKYAVRNRRPDMAIKETLVDVFIPLILIFRYRAEIKLEYRGHNIEVYFIILIAILIIIGNYIHYRAQHPLIG